MTWRLRALVQEARANIGPRHIVQLVAFIVLLTVLGTLLGSQGQRAVEQEIASRAAGSLVWTVRANENEALSVASCLGLVANDGVAAAGGVMSLQPAYELDAVPGFRVPTMLITPGALEVWDPNAPSGAAVGSDLEALGTVSVGTVLVEHMNGASSEIRGRLSHSIPVDRLRARAILPAAPVGTLSECWIRFAPSTAADGRDLLVHVFAGEDAAISRHLVPSAEIDGPAEQWSATTALQPWLVTGLLCAIAGALLSVGRRQEFAVYRTFGTSRSQVATIVSIETAITLLLAMPLSALSSILIVGALHGGAITPGVTITMAQQLAAAGLALLATTPLATLLVIGGDLTSQLKDR